MKTICKIALPLLILTFFLSKTTIATYVSYITTVNITVQSYAFDVYFLHRIDLTEVTPAGKLMNTTRPPFSQLETNCTVLRGGYIYFYTEPLPIMTIENSTWTLYLWASTVSSGKTSALTIQIDVVSSNGSIVKASVGNISGVVIDYGVSERVITILGSRVDIASTDRIRLTIHVETGSTNDPKGIIFYYDGYGTYETLYHETRLQLG